MSARIYADLTDDFCRRMRNWARWWDDSVGTIGPQGVQACNLEPVSDRYRESTEPLLWGEAEDTNKAITSLPARYEQVVRQFWLYEARSLRWHGRKRGVHHETFEIWLIRGHELLVVELRRQHAAYQAHRASARAAGAGA